jgi:3-hydroxyacyl-[acyl-carrier-protein] dehydratase
MALTDFFTFETVTYNESEIVASVVLNPQHEIYNGHFPGNPVVPGVCQVEVVKRVFNAVIGGQWSIADAKEIKFLAMIIPSEMQYITCTISYKKEAENQMKITAQLSHNDRVCMKLKASLTR